MEMSDLIKELLAELKNARKEDKIREAVNTLGNFHTVEALPALEKILKGNPGLLVKKDVIKALVLIGNSPALHLLDTLLSKPDNETRLFVVEQLSLYGKQGVLPLLLKALNDPDTSIRKNALSWFEHHMSPELCDTLLPFLSDKDEEIVVKVIGITGEFKQEKVTKALIPLLADKRENIRKAACNALALAAHDNPDMLFPLFSTNDEMVKKRLYTILISIIEDSGKPVSEFVRGKNLPPYLRKKFYRYLPVTGRAGETKVILVNAGLWLLKLLFTLSLFCTTGFLAGTLFFGESYYGGAYEFNRIFLKGSEELIIPFLGPFNSLVLLVAACLFLIPWRKMLAKSKGVSTIRDILSIYLFMWFSVVLLAGMRVVRFSTLEFTGIDFGIAAGLVVTYLVIGISNFGGMDGIGEVVKPVPVMKEFLVSMIIIGAGSLPGLFFGTAGITLYTGVVYYFFDLAFIYIIGFCIKILLYPDEIVTFSIKKDIMKVLFGLLAAIILLPFAGSGLTLLVTGLFSRFSESAWLILSHLITPSLYMFHLLLHDPVKLIFLFATLSLHIAHYGADIAEKSRIKNPGSVPFYLKIPATFSFRQEEGISIPLWIAGIVSLVFNVVYVYFLPGMID
ncbi:MAG: HEAT repeat domain-containing protein [Spirochaetales bacterium]|nr:HEAT repeat domain-containing protein [Spirochaetales bacterium]